MTAESIVVDQARRNRLRSVNKSKNRNIGPSTASAVPMVAVNQPAFFLVKLWAVSYR